MIKIITVDDHPLMRSGLKDIVQDEKDMTVIYEASQVSELLDILKSQKPDIILLDISLPGTSGFEALPKIKTLYPDINIIMLSALSEDIYASKCLDAGAMAFLSKETSPEELPQAIRKVMQGKIYISPSFAQKLAVNYMKGSVKNSLDNLSHREFEVFVALGAGLSVSEVADRINISVKTVSTYRIRIMEKMGMKKIVDIMKYCIEHNLI